MEPVSEWREVPLGELVRCQSGFAFKSRDWTTAGVPVVKIRDVRLGVVRLDGVSFVAADTAAAAERFLLRRGDVLITMSGEIGSVGVYKHERPALLNQRVGRFELLNSEAADLNFLTFALQDPAQKRYFESVAYGVAQPNISPSLIGRARMRIPSLVTQRRIAAILSAFDELIEINERRTELLEDLARALYREWFVHFRFPGHEDVELVGSELGPIPEGWEVRSFKSVAQFVNGFAFKPAHHDSVGRPIIKIKELKQGVTLATPRNAGTELDPRYLVEPGDLLFSWSADLGVYLWPGEGGLLNQHLFRVAPLPDLTREFLYHALQSALPAFRSRAEGTTMKHIKRSALDEVKLAVPSRDLVSRVSAGLAALHGEAILLHQSCAALAAIRDLLLPRLVTGRIDLSDIDLGILTPTEFE